MSQAFALAEFLKRHESSIYAEWIEGLVRSGSAHRDLISDAELKKQGFEFLKLVVEALPTESNIRTPGWAKVRDFLETISKSRSAQGFTPSQTATFVLSLKHPLFMNLGRELANSGDMLVKALAHCTELFDALGLYTVECFQKGREELMLRHQQDILELSTPVVKLWDGILALPMIGTLDSSRTSIVMETLLQRIVETGADVAIIDITGVPTVDTLTAQHLMKTVAAARLMGADCIISGIRPQIAQTIVHLAVDLGNITTKATLADAFAAALRCRRANARSSRDPNVLPPEAGW